VPDQRKEGGKQKKGKKKEHHTGALSRSHLGIEHKRIAVGGNRDSTHLKSKKNVSTSVEEDWKGRTKSRLKRVGGGFFLYLLFGKRRKWERALGKGKVEEIRQVLFTGLIATAQKYGRDWSRRKV